VSRILAIDDSPSIRELVSSTLGQDGHVVVPAVDGVEGITLSKQGRFDLVITDYNMPRMNGLAFIKAFREAGNRFTPVLVLTTEVSPQLKESAKQAGATGWIVKPFVAESFRAVVKRML
jgi:two-component system, chemotaxis family, chemotaxis protein CheY